MFDFNTNEGYFLHLLECALKTEQPKEAPEGIDFSEVLEISKRHDVENLVFVSVDKLKAKPKGELYADWQELYYMDKKRCMFQDMALDELIEAFTKEGIDCMPLKGSVIKNYYPEPDLRSMGDIDFLVAEQNRSRVRDIMHSLGYRDDLLDDGQVDGFISTKNKLVYIEIHYDFSAENHAYHDLFTIDWSKLLPTETEHLLQMSLDDLYFFNIGHYAKNMHNKGMGLRAIVDEFVLWELFSDEQKQAMLDRFDKTELGEFHKNLIKINDIWFYGREDDGSLDNVQNYLMTRLTYGDEKTKITLQTLFDNQSSSNFKYVIAKLFPAPSTLYRRFAIKHKCFLILPFLWLFRIFLQLFGDKKKWDSAKTQMDTFKTIEQEDIDFERSIRQEFGLM